ncbi:MAG: FadR/GntR family transcriptional regulator [Betaproteobacteria bacterium]
MPLQTIEPMRLYRQIAGQIASLIDSGEFRAGARLPPERELAGLLGVSRTSVREAIIALEIAGRVEVRVGTGIFVTADRRAPDAGADRDVGPGPFELLAARSLVEGEIAALAARKATKLDLTALRETIDTMRAHAGADDFAVRDAADRAFHVRVAEASGNGALPPIVRQLWDQRRGELWAKIEEHFHSPALRSKTLTDHEAITAAIAAHDADGARAAMHRHLQRVTREFQRRWEAGARPAGH